MITDWNGSLKPVISTFDIYGAYSLKQTGPLPEGITVSEDSMTTRNFSYSSRSVKSDFMDIYYSEDKILPVSDLK